VWKSLLLHEMPNGDLRNYSAVPGLVSTGSFQLNPDAIAPGQEFEFTLETPQSEVVGVSFRVRLRKPIAGLDPERIARAGTDVDFSLQRLDTPAIDAPELAAAHQALLRIGPGPTVPLGVLILPHRSYVDIRFDWHTSGQARLLLNDQLVGYHNAESPGMSVSITSLAFGRSDVHAGPGARYGVTRFFVRALRRVDALDAFSSLLPEVPPNDDPRLARCRELAREEVLHAADALRPFMALFHQQFSAPWDAESGAPEGPLADESKDAHRLAIGAASNLVQMLRRNDFKHPEQFLEPFEAFLRTLHDAVPNQFESLAQSLLLTGPRELNETCVQMLAQDRLARGQAMAPMIRLVEEASGIVEQLAGGQ
jgi:hypothetical protein